MLWKKGLWEIFLGKQRVENVIVGLFSYFMGLREDLLWKIWFLLDKILDDLLLFHFKTNLLSTADSAGRSRLAALSGNLRLFHVLIVNRNLDSRRHVSVLLRKFAHFFEILLSVWPYLGSRPGVDDLFDFLPVPPEFYNSCMSQSLPNRNSLCSSSVHLPAVLSAYLGCL